MKRYLNIIIPLSLALAAGIASFYISRSAAEAPESTPENAFTNWLELTPAQHDTVQAMEPGFQREAAELSAAFRRERQNLARLLEDTQSSNEKIMAQVEKVILAHDDLLRRVVRYVLTVRPHLKATQKQKLMHLCGRIIRGRPARGRLQASSNRTVGEEHPSPGYLRRRGWGQGRGNGGQGRGYGGGGGRGQGRGRRGRRWQGVAPSLALTPEQMQKAKELDPAFEEESQALHEEVRVLQEQFAQRLESPDSPDEDVWQRLKEFTTTYHQLERRTAQHVVLLRAYLTPKQQKDLVGLCNDCGRE